MNCPRLKEWLEERYDIAGLKALAKSKCVPEHRCDFLYYTGGVTLFLFSLQFITGMLLALYYVPHSEFAYKSIVEIVTKLHLGWFFRSLHHWGAQLAIVSLFIHLFGTLLAKGYRKPRELVWVSGFCLLGLAIFFGLSGYLLLWDERAFAAVRVATGGAGAFPVIGGFIKAMLRGGLDVTGETLIRFYAFHVAILPLLTLAIIGLHLLLVQLHGVSVPLSLEKTRLKEIPFFPNAFYKDLTLWLLTLGILVTLAD
ncbi:MAG: cytochrome b N-terminal domain-containing protein, partial [Deltaproteobacteria bacterium]|nr:cytochrome b N-terminal domain-containing protein [Deltaproteobacteria bacterium]